MQTHSNNEGAIIAAIIAVVGVIAVVGLIINAFVCWLISGALQRLPAEHRKMEPGMVWLNMIPCFPLIWNFFVFQRVPDSFQSYFASIGRTDVGDCGKQIGLWYAIATACAFVPLVQYVAGPASLVLLIISLVKFHELKGKVVAA